MVKHCYFFDCPETECDMYKKTTSVLCSRIFLVHYDGDGKEHLVACERFKEGKYL